MTMKYLKNLLGFKKDNPSQLLSEDDIGDITDIIRDYFDDYNLVKVDHTDLYTFHHNPNDIVYIINRWFFTPDTNYVEIEVYSSKSHYPKFKKIFENLSPLKKRLESMGFVYKISDSIKNLIDSSSRFTITIFK